MATSRVLILLLLLAVCLSLFSGPSYANPRPQSMFSRVTESSRANYTVSFVPLISVIANFLPRFLTRFTPQSQQARSQLAKHAVQGISAGVMEATCYEVHPYQLRWPDPKNRQQFLFCHLDPECIAELQRTGLNSTSSETRCYSLYAEKCPAKTVFDFHQQQCVYKQVTSGTINPPMGSATLEVVNVRQAPDDVRTSEPLQWRSSGSFTVPYSTCSIEASLIYLYLENYLFLILFLMVAPSQLDL